MIYNVASLLTAREGQSRTASIENGEIQTDQYRFAGINGSVTLLRTDRTVLVSASVSSMVTDTCGRCLETVELKIDTEFEEEFRPANRDLISESHSPKEVEFDPALLIDLRNMLDITEALSQSLLLSMPLVSLCKQDCAGMCLICFTDRNTAPCSCDQNPIDPRWQSLADMGIQTSNSNN